MYSLTCGGTGTSSPPNRAPRVSKVSMVFPCVFPWQRKQTYGGGGDQASESASGFPCTLALGSRLPSQLPASLFRFSSFCVGNIAGPHFAACLRSESIKNSHGVSKMFPWQRKRLMMTCFYDWKQPGRWKHQGGNSLFVELHKRALRRRPRPVAWSAEFPVSRGGRATEALVENTGSHLHS